MKLAIQNQNHYVYDIQHNGTQHRKTDVTQYKYSNVCTRGEARGKEPQEYRVWNEGQVCPDGPSFS
jgi:hypothetical protein